MKLASAAHRRIRRHLSLALRQHFPSRDCIAARCPIEDPSVGEHAVTVCLTEDFDDVAISCSANHSRAEVIAEIIRQLEQRE